jgi:hypothetical protein
MVTWFRWYSVVLGLALGAVAIMGCGPRGHAGRIRDGSDQGMAAQQLKGTWVLASFEPEVHFEPMLAGLLEAQIDTLLVTFDGATMSAEGPGIQATRNYEVVQSLFGRVDIVIFGDDGTTYEMIGQYIGDDLQFESRTPPWTGKGRLRRP